MDMVSAIIGFLTGIASKVVGDLALRDILRPQLKVDFMAPGGTYVSDNGGGPLLASQVGSYVTETFTTDANGNRLSDCHYISLRIKNEGRTTAKNCRAFLIRMERRTSGEIWVSCGDDIIQLNWAYSSKSERGAGYDLLPGMHRYVNVVSVDTQSPDRFCPATVTIPNRWKEDLNRTGAVRFTIQVAAEEAESRLRVLKVEWGSAWNKYSVSTERDDLSGQ